jgi:putative transposase
VTPAVKREAVAHLHTAFDMSERRACRSIGCVRMTVRYRSRRRDDADLRCRLRALAHERRRFGYRRLHVLLRRESFKVNHKRLFRLYREERLIVRRRGGREYQKFCVRDFCEGGFPVWYIESEASSARSAILRGRAKRSSPEAAQRRAAGVGLDGESADHRRLRSADRGHHRPTGQC